MSAALTWLAASAPVPHWLTCLGAFCTFLVGTSCVAACWMCYLCRAISKDRGEE